MSKNHTICAKKLIAKNNIFYIGYLPIKFPENMCEVKTSLIPNAGNGVFATKSYEENEYICDYDGYYKNSVSAEEFTYSTGYTNGNGYYVGYNYIRKNNKLGQFINDYCRFELTPDMRNEQGIFSISSKKIEEAILQYNTLSFEKSNVSIVFDGKKYKIKSRAKINSGDELYVSYGIQYWINHIRIIETDEPFVRLFCLLMNDDLKIKENSCVYNGREYEFDDFMMQQLCILPNGSIMRYLEIERYSSKKNWYI